MTSQKIPDFLLGKTTSPEVVRPKERGRLPILNKGIGRFAEIMKTGFIQWELASQSGFFQGLDARLKIFFLLSFAVIISLKKTIHAQIIICLFLLLLAAVSRLNLIRHYRKILILGFVFGFLIAFPSALNIVSTGKVVWPLFHLSRPHDIWIYHIPQVVGFTAEGIQGVSLLTLRVLNSLAVAFLVITTTPFAEVIKALKVMKVPDVFLMTITLAYKYIFIFALTVYDMHLAKKSRLVGPESNSTTRRWIAGRMAFLFNKSQHRCEEVFKAMQQRGFTGGISIRGDKVIRKKDWLMGLLLLGVEIILLLI